MADLMLMLFIGLLVVLPSCDAILCSTKDGKDLSNLEFYKIRIKPNLNNQDPADALSTGIQMHKKDRYVIQTPIDVDLHHWRAEVKGVNKIKVVYYNQSGSKVDMEKIKLKKDSEYQQVWNTEKVQATEVRKIVFKFTPTKGGKFFHVRELQMLTCHERV